MNHYYKAVRPDGTDFRTGTVDYASLSLTGGKLPRLPGGECCTDGVYHAADVPSETLIGGSWPCRLFVVTGKPVAQEGHKFGFRTMKVVGELEAWQALGPNGKETVALIDRIGQATPDQINRLDAARAAAQAAARDAARAAARAAARDAARAAARAAAWYAAGYAARAAAGYAAWYAAGYAARAAAGYAAWYAALAVLTRDLITPEQFDKLYGPWASVMDE